MAPRETRASLGPYTFLVDPTSIQWDFRIRMSEQHTVGGRVIQVFGTDLGDMIVKGTLGRGDGSDDGGWRATEEFIDKIEDLAQRTSDESGKDALTFRVPSQEWEFEVYIKALEPPIYSESTINHEFTLTLFIVEDVTRKITRGVVDKYIQRLVEGVGWEQSEYNGPTEKEVEELLAPAQGSPGLAYKNAIVEAFVTAMQASGLGGLSGTVGAVGDMAGPEGINQFLWALRDQESGHNYTVVNEIGAAGAYQYMPGTWANYKGYSSAHLAPPEIQDEKAAADVARHYATHKDWGLVAAIWYSGQPIGPSSPQWNVSQGGYPSIASYVNSILSKMAAAPS